MAMNNLTQRILTGSVFLIVMIGSMLWSIYSVYAVFFTVMLFCTHEYIQLANKIVGNKLNKILIYILNIIFFGYVFYIIYEIKNFNFNLNPLIPQYTLKYSVFSSTYNLIFYLSIVPVVIFLVEIFRKTTKSFQTIVLTCMSFIYVTIPLALVTQIGLLSFLSFKYIIIAYFICIWLNDSFAYVWGKLLGKHKLAPHISAGKTIEGTLGGIITTVGISFLFPYIFDCFDQTWKWNLFALLISIVCTFSDLSESLLKREAGVKDSGNLLPGHGGFLDRFDSVLLTAPVVYIYLNLVN